MKDVPLEIKKLKKVEQMAILDKRKAYKACLSYQAEYAFLQEKSYFEVYSYVLHLLYRKSSPVHCDHAKSATEQDFVGEVWSPIIASIFRDDLLKVRWGNSVSELSTAAKKRPYQDCDQNLGD